MRERPFDVAVLGAGIAGLSAAHALVQAGRHVALIEARPRVGGRIYSVTTDAGNLPVELGAEFVHGKPEELWQLISSAGVTAFELDGDMFDFFEGQLRPAERSGDFSILEELPTDKDWTFSEWIEQQQFPPAKARSVASYVEGFNAADAGIIGTAALAKQQQAEDAIEGSRLFRIKEGYVSLAEYLLRQMKQAGGELFLSTVVDTVTWKRGNVRVQANSHDGPTLFSARQCIITLPLGVLQAGSVRFDPVPESHMQAAGKLAMGSVKKIIFVFRERFWAAQYPDASFIFSENDLPGVWWTPSPDASPTITGWIGGPRTQESSIATHEALRHKALAALAKLFSLSVEEIEYHLHSWHIHDWDHDPFSRGAYSYVPKDALPALDILTQPIEDTLFLAGEHTDLTGHWGTVHAAIGTGLRAARQAQSSAR
jgi:monoamine oxidase